MKSDVMFYDVELTLDGMVMVRVVSRHRRKKGASRPPLSTPPMGGRGPAQMAARKHRHLGGSAQFDLNPSCTYAICAALEVV